MWFSALPVLLIAATFTWLLSLPLRNVSIVDSLWSLMFFAAGVIYALRRGSARTAARRSCCGSWCIWAAGCRLHHERNMGKGEDHRYQAIRARNQPRFALKSLYLVFWLQAMLAWIISLPLLGAFSSNAPLGVLDYARHRAVAHGIGVRGRRRLATGALQAKSGQCRAGHGPRLLALHPPP